MYLSKQDIENMEHIRRLNIINSISGIKPANLIGSISNDKKTNLAIFSSVIHLGSNPALLGFILRPKDDVPRHTFENIMQNGSYTINHIHESFAKQAHYTSAKFDKDKSEFTACGFTEEYLYHHAAPFVKESNVKMGMKFLQSISIEANNTFLVIGQIEHLIIPEEAVAKEGHIDLSSVNDVGISGLNNYYSLTKIAEYPYARVSELPLF
jgi:flavin reductase (DIM6/NTAB) family NADH-FMN oxidoreductase RutF